MLEDGSVKPLNDYSTGLPDFSWYQNTKTGKYIPNGRIIYVPTVHKIYQMSIKYTNIFHCKTLQNLPKFELFGLKIYRLATLLFNSLLLIIDCMINYKTLFQSKMLSSADANRFFITRKKKIWKPCTWLTSTKTPSCCLFTIDVHM
jgi:hypothetical protein